MNSSDDSMANGDGGLGGMTRRRFLRNASLALAATELSLGVGTMASAQTTAGTAASAASAGSNTSFDAIKEIEAGVLKISYAEVGPKDGKPVVLLHGWPYDIHSYVDVAPLLAAKGYRVIVPYLRGYGGTRFLSDKSFRNGQQAAVALDIIKLMDALGIKQAIIGGFDWGARTADIMAVLWPERCKALVAVSGYLITNLKANKLTPLPPVVEYAWWYQYYFATERGVVGYEKNRYDFNKLIWKNVSPKWNFDDATYDRTAKAFENPDHVAIVIHNYRWRIDLAPGEAKYDAYEAKLAESPDITVPTITLASDFDGAGKDGSRYAGKYTGKYSHKVLDGIGHNVPQEAPQAFADAIVEVDGY